MHRLPRAPPALVDDRIVRDLRLDLLRSRSGSIERAMPASRAGVDAVSGENHERAPGFGCRGFAPSADARHRLHWATRSFVVGITLCWSQASKSSSLPDSSVQPGPSRTSDAFVRGLTSVALRLAVEMYAIISTGSSSSGVSAPNAPVRAVITPSGREASSM